MRERDGGNPKGLCVETKGREILARMVHGEIDAAMRIGLFDRAPAEAVDVQGTVASAIKAPRVKRAR